MKTSKLSNLFIAYVFAVAAACMGFFFRLAITRLVGPGLPTYITFYPFIMLVAVAGGLGPGLLTTAASALLVDYWILPPQESFVILNRVDLAGMVLFVTMGILMSGVAESYRRKHEAQEEALRQANSYNRTLLEVLIDPLVTINKDGKITDANEAASKVRGVSKEALLGTDFSDYFTEPERAREGYQRVFAQGSIFDYPLTIRRKDGKLTDVLYNASVYKDAKGDIGGVLAAARDVTELKHLQDRLLRSEKLAVVGKLASSVAHELRNPLGVMKNTLYYLKMLGWGKGNPEIEENVAIMHSEIENADKIISDLLQFCGLKKPTLGAEDLNSMIEATLKRLSVPANIKVVTAFGENLPPLQIDALHMQQVFYNLALNAIQAMEAGGILTISSGLTYEGTITVAFKDTGCGIPQENLQKIFEPLFSTKAKGTGLGLSVVAMLVEGHEGKIEVESEVN